MTRGIQESDWKKFKHLHQVALDRFCSRVLIEIAEIAADSSQTPHRRYLAVYDTIQYRDREILKKFDEPRRSTALWQLAALRSCGLVGDEEFMTFTEETRSLIKVYLDDGI